MSVLVETICGMIRVHKEKTNESSRARQREIDGVSVVRSRAEDLQHEKVERSRQQIALSHSHRRAILVGSSSLDALGEMSTQASRLPQTIKGSHDSALI